MGIFDLALQSLYSGVHLRGNLNGQVIPAESEAGQGIGPPARA